MSSDVYVYLAGLSGSIVGAAATLGAVILSTRSSAKAELLERQRQAYADLLVAAGDVLGMYRRSVAALSPDFGPQDADQLNDRMDDLGAALHRASAMVALTGSIAGREQGKMLYGVARQLTASCISPTGDSAYPYQMITRGGDMALEAAIDTYKTVVVKETAALP